MNRYQPSTPRAVTAVAAVVMTVITVVVFIIAPAAIQNDAGAGAAGAVTMAVPLELSPS